MLSENSINDVVFEILHIAISLQFSYNLEKDRGEIVG